jgi:hypothetical protein
VQCGKPAALARGRRRHQKGAVEPIIYHADARPVRGNGPAR